MNLPADTPFDEVLVVLREARKKTGNVGKIAQVVLQDGQRVKRVASIVEILRPDGSVHHHFLDLETIRYTKKDGFVYESKNSFKIDDQSEDSEIAKLSVFLHSHLSGELAGKLGNVRVVGEKEYFAIDQIREIVPDLAADDRFDLVKSLLEQIEAGGADELRTVFEGIDRGAVHSIASAARLAEYQVELDEMRSLIENQATTEHQLQRQLEKSPWMFGSEYSELLDRRKWTRDENVDYMLRRTVDGYLELVEIKQADEALFGYDGSHNSYYPRASLSKVIAQVVKYIDAIENDKNRIVAIDGENPGKIRARIIIGRDGSSDEERDALRNLNAHLHRIEIMTYDQLIRIAERVLSIFKTPEETPAAPAADWDDVFPF